MRIYLKNNPANFQTNTKDRKQKHAKATFYNSS